MRTVLLLLTICTATALFLADHARAQQAKQARPAFPAETICPTPLAENAPGTWSAQEQWAWDKRICLGKIADLSTRPAGKGGGCDVSKAEDWPDDRVLKPQFIQTILLHEPFRSAFVRRGVRIRCAKFEKHLDMSQVHIKQELWLNASFFAGGIAAVDLKIDNVLSLRGSRCDDRFTADRLIVGGSLLLREGAQFKDVFLRSAKIGANLDAVGSHFEGRFIANSITVGGNRSLRGEAEFQDVVLIGAEIGGNLETDGSRFEGIFNADSITVGGYLFLRVGAEFQDVVLLGAKIGRNLDLRGSTFTGKFNLAGGNVLGELLLGDAERFATWSEGSVLLLRNASVGALNDRNCSVTE